MAKSDGRFAEKVTTKAVKGGKFICEKCGASKGYSKVWCLDAGRTFCKKHWDEMMKND